MFKLNNEQVSEVIEFLKSGERLPLEYRDLLFPPEQNDYDLRKAIRKSKIEQIRDHKQSIILVVDDNEDNRMLLSDQLEWQGYQVRTAENGLVALEMLRAEAVDLVLLDIMMPEMDGYEVLHELRHDDRLNHIPVVMITAVEEVASVARCIELGATDYLPKPFNPIILNARISASLEKKHLRDAEQIYLRRLEEEQDKSEKLLLNILPQAIAEQLKQHEGTIADAFADVTVLFADIVDFTKLSAGISATELVEMLNTVFSSFDQLVEKHQLEKIKTNGDSYLVVGGMPVPREDHAEATANMALDMQSEIERLKQSLGTEFRMRIGIHSGPAIAGVIGAKKFIYDLWGDTVNTASRMERLSLPDAIQVTEEIYNRLKDRYTFESRGKIKVKGKGEMQTYFLTGRLPG